MELKRIDASPVNYVVVDIETNGTRKDEHDLLSIAFYKPDDGKSYSRLLPLDLNDKVDPEKTAIHGICSEDLLGKTHISQDEFDRLVSDFELDSRLILHYGSLDERFIRSYCERHYLRGTEKLKFFNFKSMICSSRFSNGAMSKDNLCSLFGIDDVQKVHSALNDCKLEWAIFEKMNGRPLFALERFNRTYVFELNEDYIVPASYFYKYPNLKKVYNEPHIRYESTEVFHLEIKSDRLYKFLAKIEGQAIEKLLRASVGARNVDNHDFAYKNRAKLKPIGYIKDAIIPVRYFSLDDYGHILAWDGTYVEEFNAANESIDAVRENLEPLVRFIKKNIFKSSEILYQELRVDKQANVLAICDLSNKYASLEIKSTKHGLEKYADQFYYQSKGRECFVLHVERSTDEDSRSTSISFRISQLTFSVGNQKERGRTHAAWKRWQGKLNRSSIQIEKFEGVKKPIFLKCKQCSLAWKIKYSDLTNNRYLCPKCNPESAPKRYRKKS